MSFTMVENKDSASKIENIIESGDPPKLCQNKKCCAQYILFAEKDNQKVLLPLKKVDIKSELRGATAISTIELTYVNPH